jgi:DNA-binding NarL/FixJ family response regulator
MVRSGIALFCYSGHAVTFRPEFETKSNMGTMKKGDKASIYIIDDHPLLVQGLTDLINAQPDMKVTGTTPEWTVALSQFQKEKPDVVILDITLKNANGVEVLKNLRVHFPDLKVLMLSMHDESLYAMRALKAGAQGYIMKAAATEKVIVAVRQILSGELYLSEEMSRRAMATLVGRKKETGGSPLEDLSDRELEVFTLIGEGLTTRQIADKLHLSVKTIETHRAHIKEKLNLKNSTELVQHAIHWKS